jgi:hypothetical protein
MVWKIERKLAKMTSFIYRSSSYLFYGTAPEFIRLTLLFFIMMKPKCLCFADFVGEK